MEQDRIGSLTQERRVEEWMEDNPVQAIRILHQRIKTPVIKW